MHPGNQTVRHHQAPPRVGASGKACRPGFSTDALYARTQWANELVAPHRENRIIAGDEDCAQSELDTIKSLFSRIRIPWRYFLAESVFLQISIPEIATIVSNSSTYATNPAERIEATRKFFKTIIMHGPDSPEGIAAITRVNQVHQNLGINPRTPAFSFVLFTLSYEFIESLRRNSRHRPSNEEALALYSLMRRVGERMGSLPLPTSYSEFIEANQRFKEDCWAASSSVSRSVAHSLLDNVLSRVPAFLRPATRCAILSLISDEVRNQLQLDRPSKLARSVVHALFCSIA